MDRVGDGHQEILERRAGNYGKGGVEGKKKIYFLSIKGTVSRVTTFLIGHLSPGELTAVISIFAHG
jgi:hypothetical protein